MKITGPELAVSYMVYGGILAGCVSTDGCDSRLTRSNLERKPLSTISPLSGDSGRRPAESV